MDVAHSEPSLMPNINVAEVKDANNPLIQCLRPADPISIFDGFLCCLMIVIVIEKDVEVNKSREVVQLLEVRALGDEFLCSIAIIASGFIFPESFL